MDQVTPEEGQSKSIVDENIEALKSLFPDAFTEDVIDFEALRQLLGDEVAEGDEKYGLTWHGKKKARQIALTPSTGTLRPCPEESVDWETTQNLFIEGDNLEVLKLLQRSYAASVKVIYIDPPYNTGEEFIYPDKFQENLETYLQYTGQKSEGGLKFTSNTEAGGRKHTNWLSMMLPRLKLSLALLKRDGVAFISIDDNEVNNLKYLCNEVFGEENFIAQMVWEGAFKNDARQIGTNHEYVLVYAKNRSELPKSWGLDKEGVEPVLREVKRLRTLHGEDFESASADLAAWYKAKKATPSFAHRRFKKIDANGAYKEDDPTAPGGRKFDLTNPKTGDLIPLRQNRGWSFDQATFETLVKAGRISFISPTSIMVRRYLHETDSTTPQSVFYQPARSASERLTRLMGENVFDFPKDELILRDLIAMATDPGEGDVVMDFFAGSGTTAHAVWLQNIRDNGNRRFVLVQLPEPISADKQHQAVAAQYCQDVDIAPNIASLARHRIRLCIENLSGEPGGEASDFGYRAFALDSSNIQTWNPDRGDLDQTLLDHQAHLIDGRSEQDVLYELLLKCGVDLAAPIEEREAATKTIFSIGSGVLFACLSERVDKAQIEALARAIIDWHRELAPGTATQVVFRDSAFEDDIAKSNMTAILEQNGISHVRSL